MSDKPYRPNVGIALFNAAGLVLAGHRFADAGPEIVLPDLEWQMPQGGIDDGEDLIAAARRELWEETNVRSVAFLAANAGWWRYDFPPYEGPPHRLSPFRGQRQRWVAFRFEGAESEIDVTAPGGGEAAEFDAWGWFPLGELPAMVVPFRRPVYEQVVEAFGAFGEEARR